jgi:hypothetical protein
MRENEAVSATERRRSQRLCISVPVFVRGLDMAGKEYLQFATALNLSSSGALIATRRHLAPGSDVTLEIPVDPLLPAAVLANSPRVVRARVVRNAPETPSDPAMRFMFLGLQFKQPLRET